MTYYVEYSGYVAVEAKNKEEAIEVANEDLFDLDMIAYTSKQWEKHNNNAMNTERRKLNDTYIKKTY